MAMPERIERPALMDDPNDHRRSKRRQKAQKIAATLVACKATLTQVKGLDDDGWRKAAKCAGYEDASPIVREYVIFLMSKRLAGQARNAVDQILIDLDTRQVASPPDLVLANAIKSLASLVDTLAKELRG